MKGAPFGHRAEETVAVRLFLWIGLLTTMSCSALAVLAATKSLTF